MQLTCAKVTNFRVLQDVEVKIDKKATLVVGRNNSGKTSFANLFDKFFGSDDTKFVLEDLSVSRIKGIKSAVEAYRTARAVPEDSSETREEQLKAAEELIPAISLQVVIAYTVEDDLALLSGIILDLGEDCLEARLEAVLSVKRPRDLLEQADAALARQGPAFDWGKFLRKNFSTFYAPSYWAVSALDPNVRREITPAAARRVLSVKSIHAQPRIDDVPADRARTLSKTFETFYKANSADEERNQNIEGIEQALAVASKSIDTNYDLLFRPILDELRTFGVGTIAPLQTPEIISLIESGDILRGSTRIQYASPGSDHPLPEGHNGLGYSKLISTVVQVIGFYHAYLRLKPRPALQLLFIEEPEAHLHPQMQEVFISNINRLLEREEWAVQAVLTTHSSHIVASSGFGAVRYFDSNGPTLKVKDLSDFEHATKQQTNGKTTLQFLAQYMHTHRCDMFFADRIILIEGTAERLLLRAMISKCAPELANQYISIIEVGDAYAARFKTLLEFLGVPALVITDLDSVDPATKKRCAPDTGGALTSNATLKDWMPKLSEVKALLQAPAGAKVCGNVRVAYEVPEADGGPCGRSFEDAMIIANADMFARNLGTLALKNAFTSEVGIMPSPEAIAAAAFSIAERLSRKKTDFAFDMVITEGWTVPRYIREGLQWLMR
ncbi:AAA family ATPase [Streptomyces sp. NBC_01317]|uniref:AAA family ATPase n=1 Tax=Streptomyces sp. NBC_01317 TaxID=2903822 RepID=UPI002E14CD0E|nr:AAA family ATPase [Streptomyces sp. NBC_01317]